MAERKAIPKKIRFEVFKRDKFTCQYCGRSAPDVILEIDHIIPVSKGGQNEIINLITSCKDCNRGKSDKTLSDDSVIKKQQEQINELAEKNEQLEMIIKWRNDLKEIELKEIDTFCDIFREKIDFSGHINENGKKKVKKWIKEFGIVDLLDALDIAINQYYSNGSDNIELVFNKIPGICHNRKSGQSKQKYWFNYLKKACNSRYYDAHQYMDELASICFRHIKTEEDFNNARIMLYENDRAKHYIYALEDYFI